MGKLEVVVALGNEDSCLVSLLQKSHGFWLVLLLEDLDCLVVAHCLAGKDRNILTDKFLHLFLQLLYHLVSDFHLRIFNILDLLHVGLRWVDEEVERVADRVGDVTAEFWE